MPAKFSTIFLPPRAWSALSMREVALWSHVRALRRSWPWSWLSEQASTAMFSKSAGAKRFCKIMMNFGSGDSRLEIYCSLRVVLKVLETQHIYLYFRSLFISPVSTLPVANPSQCFIIHALSSARASSKTGAR